MRVLTWQAGNHGWVARIEDAPTPSATTTMRFADVFVPKQYAPFATLPEKLRKDVPVYVTFADRKAHKGMPRFPNFDEAKLYVESVYALES